LQEFDICHLKISDEGLVKGLTPKAREWII
jgi:hypothetical protein